LPTETLEAEVKMRGLAVKRVIHFGEFVLSDPPSHLLKNGDEVHLRPQVMRALLLLAESPGEIVSRDDLRRAIWGDGQDVEVERGIKTVIRELRKALGDAPSDPRYVETVRGAGYRFVAREKLTEEPLIRVGARPRRRISRIWLAAIGVTLVLASLAAWATLRSSDPPTLLLPRVRADEGSAALMPLCGQLSEKLALALLDQHSEYVSLVHIFGPTEELSMSPRVARYAADIHLFETGSEGQFRISMELFDRRDGTIQWMGTYSLASREIESWPERGARDLVAAVLEAST
jgi:DNA-binding winged helix-turn-helix (wHTH) protein